jgi:hypothetical protein
MVEKTVVVEVEVSEQRLDDPTYYFTAPFYFMHFF